ncbi:MAG: cytoskeleton protein RodZ, partial [Frankiaceae bacterium]|nr:cytoskeleton protein RodZ [Frankiaceae bacterium]
MSEQQLDQRSDWNPVASQPGRAIAEARAAQGLTLDELTAATCIRAGILRRMEADDFDACGGDFYARGHLRLVGQALHLDVHSLVDAFDRDHPDGDPVDEP